MDTVICKEVVITTLKRRGDGTVLDPTRVVTEVYEKGGDLIAEYDPVKTFTLKEMGSFALFVANNEHTKTDILTLYTNWKDSL
jgi:hypothetical protein